MIVIYFIAHSEWILHRSRADMVKLLKSNFQIVSVSPLNEYVDEIKEDYLFIFLQSSLFIYLFLQQCFLKKNSKL